MNEIVEYFRKLKAKDDEDFGNRFHDYFTMRFQQEKKKNKDLLFDDFSLKFIFRYGDKSFKVQVLMANPDVLVVKHVLRDGVRFEGEEEFTNPASITGFREVKE